MRPSDPAAREASASSVRRGVFFCGTGGILEFFAPGRHLEFVPRKRTNHIPPFMLSHADRTGVSSSSGSRLSLAHHASVEVNGSPGADDGKRLSGFGKGRGEDFGWLCPRGPGAFSRKISCASGKCGIFLRTSHSSLTPEFHTQGVAILSVTSPHRARQIRDAWISDDPPLSRLNGCDFRHVRLTRIYLATICTSNSTVD